MIGFNLGEELIYNICPRRDCRKDELWTIEISIACNWFPVKELDTNRGMTEILKSPKRPTTRGHPRYPGTNSALRHAAERQLSFLSLIRGSAYMNLAVAGAESNSESIAVVGFHRHTAAGISQWAEKFYFDSLRTPACGNRKSLVPESVDLSLHLLIQGLNPSLIILVPLVICTRRTLPNVETVLSSPPSAPYLSGPQPSI